MRSFLLLIILIVSQCKPLSFNNPSDGNTKAFLETQLLRCFLEDKECFEIPQDNQGNKQWTRLLGQTGFDTYSLSNAAERNGFIYQLGTTTGSLLNQPKISPTTDNYVDIFVSQFDREGNVHRLKQMGSSVVSSTYAELIHIDAFGDLCIVGSSNGPFNELPASGGGSLVIKMHPSGIVFWTRIFPTGDETLGSGITSDNEGNVYITGNTETQVVNGETAGNTRNVIIFKYSRNGDLIWTRLIGQVGFTAYGHQIQFDPVSNHLFVTGIVGGSGSFLGTTLPGGVSDSFLFSLDTNGVIKWSRYLGLTSATTTIVGMSLDKKGSVYLVGDTSGNLDGQSKDGNTVQALTKFSVSGEKIWTRLLNGGGTSNTNGIQVYADNAFHVYTTGYTTGNLNGNTLIGVQDAYLSKYDGNGNLIWTKTTGNSGSTLYGRGISADRYGTIYYSGFTNGSIDGQVKQGAIDSFLMKYQ
ncbi:hypothetical protein EHQ59_15875 [Leptospira kemamanensis]|uniref:Beta-propeller repeat protein n=1 Tax=Leptospira kemamanensis TaxID=2484942 RepID=A0A4R9JMJ2_9LEPT|nr:SBBP repeat-containing protein [Leptospira kemamanensis]TGL48189.1 hypothetical protein EHQ59_15875 [Leptospira kemamanensis]